MNPQWRTSSHSTANGGECVEIGRAPWRTSSYSTGNGGQCVETGRVPGAVLVRDTKDNAAGPVLRVTPGDWARFTRGIKAR